MRKSIPIPSFLAGLHAYVYGELTFRVLNKFKEGIQFAALRELDWWGHSLLGRVSNRPTLANAGGALGVSFSFKFLISSAHARGSPSSRGRPTR